MEQSADETAEIRSRLLSHRAELHKRVSTIHEHARVPLDQDSAEQAAQLGNIAVVSALESEAIQQIADIEAAIQRLDAGTYGICISCGELIGAGRLAVRPAATECLDCAGRASPRS